MSEQIWIDADPHDGRRIGDSGFLILVARIYQGESADSHVLLDEPPRTNMGGQPLLYGWCGTTNGIALFARGMARIKRFSKSGRRALVREIFNADLARELVAHGYPNLWPDQTEIGLYLDTYSTEDRDHA